MTVKCPYCSAIYDIEESERIIAKNNEDINELQGKLADGMKAHYRSNSLGFIDVVLGSSSFADLINRWEQYDRLTDAEAAMVAKAKDLKERNEAEKAELELRQTASRDKLNECNELRSESKEKLEELQRLQSELDSEYQGLLEEMMGEALAEAMKNIKIQITGPNGLDPALAVVEYAKSRLGCPYVWAAEGPTAFDCSGLVMWCYAQVGIAIPHYTESQYALALSRGAVLALKDVQPGDVLYRPGHVAIAIENGGASYIHAPTTGDVVRVANYQQFVCGLRFAGAVNKTVEEARADAEAQPAPEPQQEEQKKEEQKQEEKQSADNNQSSDSNSGNNSKPTPTPSNSDKTTPTPAPTPEPEPSSEDKDKSKDESSSEDKDKEESSSEKSSEAKATE